MDIRGKKKRDKLRAALLKNTQSPQNLAETIQKRFAELGGIDRIPTTPREPMREPPQFEP